MIFFAETLGTSCTSVPNALIIILISQVLSHPRLFGLPTTDQLGLESLGIFWSLIETGVAIPVACLPTLRPMFQGLSPESVLNSIRSMISLSSKHSQQDRETRSSYDFRSQSGSFEMQSRSAFRHKPVVPEYHGSHRESSVTTAV